MRATEAYWAFHGDWDWVPIRAHLVYGEVPAYPVAGDFHLAVTDADGSQDVAAHWRREAIRERIHRPGCSLDAETLKAIALRAAATLYKALREAA